MLLHSDSFNHYIVLPGGKWSTFAGNGSVILIDTTHGRSDGGCLKVIAASAGTTTLFKSLGVARSTLTMGFAIFWASGTTGANIPIIQFMDGSVTQVELRFTPTLQMLFTRNGTTLGSPTVTTITTGSWHYIQIQVTFHGSAGTAALFLDGVQLLNLTGQNTSNTGTTTASGFQFMGAIISGDTETYYIDDLYVADTTGSVNNGFLGDVSVIAELPSGNGTQNDFTATGATWVASLATPLYTQIIDSNGNIQECTANTGDTKTGTPTHPSWQTTVGLTTTDNHVTWTCRGTQANWKFTSELSPDGDNSYVASATTNAQERYTYPTLPGVGTAAIGVTVWAYCEKDNAGSRLIRAVAKSGGVVGTSPSDLAVAGSYSYLAGVLEIDPSTGVAWTIAGVNAAEIGVELIF